MRPFSPDSASTGVNKAGPGISRWLQSVGCSALQCQHEQRAPYYSSCARIGGAIAPVACPSGQDPTFSGAC
eukprot:1986030-Alexandrium_andersonii.AAC.1